MLLISTISRRKFALLSSKELTSCLPFYRVVFHADAYPPVYLNVARFIQTFYRTLIETLPRLLNPPIVLAVRFSNRARYYHRIALARL